MTQAQQAASQAAAQAKSRHHSTVKQTQSTGAGNRHSNTGTNGGFLTDSQGHAFRKVQASNSTNQSQDFLDQVQSHNDYMRRAQTIHDQAQQNMIQPPVCTTGMPNLI
jgi:hypothetical protein